MTEILTAEISGTDASALVASLGLAVDVHALAGQPTLFHGAPSDVQEVATYLRWAGCRVLFLTAGQAA